MAETLPRFGLPEVQFLETDASAIEAGIIAGYETAAKRPLAAGDPVRLFLLTIAAEIAQLRAEVNISAQQNILSYAQGEYLDALGSYFGVTRLPASKARTTLRYTLSAALQDPVVIPAGSQVANGQITFETDAEASVPAGDLYVDVPATCTTAGASGNGWLPGQLNAMVEPIAYVAEVANTTTSADGGDEEDDASLAERIKLAPNSFSTAGPRRAYEYHTYSASAAITDVAVDSPTPGLVNIYILAQGGTLPSQELVDATAEYLSAEDRRPLTDDLHVYAPTATEFGVVLKYYISVERQAEIETIRANVDKAVQDYVEWQTKKIGRDIVPDKLVQLAIEAGAWRVDAATLEPEYTAVDLAHVAQCTGVSVTYMGLANE